MVQRASRLELIILVSLGVCGCAQAADSNPSAAPHGGSIELALSETCITGSDQCIPVGDEHVIRPSGFEGAGVEDAVANSENQQNSVDVTFTDEGAKIVNDLTTQASGAGTESRLLVKVGDEIVAAVSVQEPLRGDRVAFGLSPEDDSDAIVELIRGGSLE